jgi:hypothetical protein
LKLEISNDIAEIEAWDKNNQQHHIILIKAEKPISNLPLTRSDQWSVLPNPKNGHILVEIVAKEDKLVKCNLINAVDKIVFIEKMKLAKRKIL